METNDKLKKLATFGAMALDYCYRSWGFHPLTKDAVHAGVLEPLVGEATDNGFFYKPTDGIEDLALDLLNDTKRQAIESLKETTSIAQKPGQNFTKKCPELPGQQSTK